MADSIQETPESPSETIDRLSNNVQTLSHQLRDIANILGVDVDEIASAILRERKESKARESAAVQGEREAIKAHLDSDAFMPSEWAQRQPLNVYCWERGVADVMTYIDSRGPAPAVDVLAVVREYVEADDAYQRGMGDFDSDAERDVAGDRWLKASDALRALVDGKGEAKDGDKWGRTNEDEYRAHVEEGKDGGAKC